MRRRRGIAPGEVELQVGERCFEFGIEGYTPGSPGSYWDPPDSGEIELSSVVYVDGEAITLETATLDYALANGLTVDKAESAIYDRLLEYVEQYAAERECD